ncbi:hypothetical protein [Frankia tisae]|uniref:hypothetical protein n=1 Tax=Frankia tisae TaxID=2950104 RepID=UPI0021C055C8|nr:hypothetical protein [Frankia tisae]
MPDTGQGLHRVLNIKSAERWHPAPGTTASNALFAVATLLAATLFLILVVA